VNLGTLRTPPGMLIPDEPAGRRGLVLDQRQGRYLRVPSAAVDLLERVATAEWGIAYPEAAQLYPEVKIARLIALGLLDHVPPTGLPVPPRMAAEYVAENLRAQLLIRVRGWTAIRRWIHTGATQSRPTCRPVLLDTLEGAARFGSAVPVTSTQCTVVALALAAMARHRRFAAAIVIASDSSQHDPHCFVLVDGHRVDPSQDQICAPIFRPIGR
jgi:hypothetical protein